MRFDAIPLDVLERCRDALSRPDRAAGDAEFEALAEQLLPDLRALLFGLLRDHDETDDVLVECLVRIHRHLPSLLDLGKFPAWIIRMAVNQVHGARAKSSARPMTTLDADDAPEPEPRTRVGHAATPPSPRAAAEGRQMRATLDAALGTLPPRQRDSVTLYEIEGMSVREVALTLECSEGAVKFHLHEGRKKLRNALGATIAGTTTAAAPAHAREMVHGA